MWDGRKTIFDRLTTEADKAEAFGVVEFALPAPASVSSQGTQMIFDGRIPAAGVRDGQLLRFRFSPRDAKVWPYVIRSDSPELDGAHGRVHRCAATGRSHQRPFDNASQLVDRRSRSGGCRGCSSWRAQRQSLARGLPP